MRHYLTAHAGGLVETRDLQRAMEDESGRSLGRFFDQWVHKPGHPEMDVHVAWDRGLLTVATKQTQSTTDGVPGCFELTLDLDLGSAAGGGIFAPIRSRHRATPDVRARDPGSPGVRRRRPRRPHRG